MAEGDPSHFPPQRSIQVTPSFSTTDFNTALEQVLREQDRVRARQVTTKQGAAEVTEWLEQHAREFCINGMLNALNWRLVSHRTADEYVQANMGVETELKADTTRRLDYFGFCRDTDRPLLVVEAKRPSLRLPLTNEAECDPYAHPSGEAIAEYLGGQQADGTRRRLTDHLSKEWRRYLDQVSLYANALIRDGCPPLRIALTNGQWLIVFRDVPGAFASEDVQGSHIAVFPRLDPLSTYNTEIFDLLDYRGLTLLADPLQPADVSFALNPATVVGSLKGVHVKRWEEGHRFQDIPRVTVSPCIFLLSTGHSAVQVSQHREGILVPRTGDAMSSHLEEVEQLARSLEQEVIECLGLETLQTTSIEEHFANDEAFNQLPAVRRLRNADTAEFLLVTGQHSHWLRASLQYERCPYHEHSRCVEEGVSATAASVPISVEGHVLFGDGDARHCAHERVHTTKRNAVSEDNHERCGNRSAGVGHAFCEVWALERHLCCRVCAYERVCTNADVFNAPCIQVSVEGWVTNQSRASLIHGTKSVAINVWKTVWRTLSARCKS